MRYFVNKMPDLVAGSSVHVDRARWKDKVVRTLDSVVRHMPPTVDHCDGGLYVGCVGVAYALFHVASGEAFADKRDELLHHAKNYAEVALGYTFAKGSRDAPTSFLLGGAGACVVGALISDACGERDTAARLIRKYQDVGQACLPISFAKGGSDELFVGRAGYVCGALTLNRHFRKQVISDEILSAVCKSMIQSGREYAHRHRSPCPLMYAYYDTEYLGAGHGLVSILLMLLCCPLFLAADQSAQQDVRRSLDFMLSVTQSNGNLPTAMDEVGGRGHRSEENELVHWCHGAPGAVYLYAKAYLQFGDERYLGAALRCGELTWQRGLLRKGPGICHGVAGSGYVFLLLHRLTGDPIHLHRAAQFADFMSSSTFKEGARTPDTPYSLYEGLAGTACFLADLLQPQLAHFPLFDVFV